MAIDGGAPVSAELARFDGLVGRYPDYLRGQRGLSENPVRIYLDDIGSFRQYLCLEEATLEEMDRAMIRGYMAWLVTDALDGKGYARVSVARKLTVLRSFYLFLVQQGWFKNEALIRWEVSYVIYGFFKRSAHF